MVVVVVGVVNSTLIIEVITQWVEPLVIEDTKGMMIDEEEEDVVITVVIIHTILVIIVVVETMEVLQEIENITDSQEEIEEEWIPEILLNTEILMLQMILIYSKFCPENKT